MHSLGPQIHINIKNHINYIYIRVHQRPYPLLGVHLYDAFTNVAKLHSVVFIWPNKTTSVFQVKGRKNLGRVCTQIFFI